MTSTSPSQPPILIIGAGIIGLTLAQALQARSIPFIIYERDPHAAFRGPGWALSIHWAKAILERLLPKPIFAQLPTAYVDPEAVGNGERGAFVHYDALTGKELFRVPPSERVRLRREAFRARLLEGIKVSWGKIFKGFSIGSDGTAVAKFEDGTSSDPGAIIIGCDGSRSKVRRALLPGASENKQLPVGCLGVTAVFSTPVVQHMRALDPFFMQMGDKSQDVFLFFSFLDGPGQQRPGREAEPRVPDLHVVAC